MASIMGKQVPNIWSGGNINIDVSPKFLLLVYIRVHMLQWYVPCFYCRGRALTAT